MGLAETKRRVRYGNDPNNTSWTRSTDTFGHRFLAQRGWNPGQALGSRSAKHAGHYTSASLKGVNVGTAAVAAMFDDRSGLGSKVPVAGSSDKFGLNMFERLLGRLNAGDETDQQRTEREEKERAEDVAMAHRRRFGSILFIYGGLLEGTIETGLTRARPAKRVREAEETNDEGEGSSSESSRSDSGWSSRKRRKAEKEAKRAEKYARKAAKAERKAARAEKRRLKDEKKSKKSRQGEQEGNVKSNPASMTNLGAIKSDESSDGENVCPDSATISTTKKAPFHPRLLSRRRFIASKKMAIQDEQRMKEIFMIKTPAA